jgi:hypothetical protein
MEQLFAMLHTKRHVVLQVRQQGAETGDTHVQVIEFLHQGELIPLLMATSKENHFNRCPGPNSLLKQVIGRLGARLFYPRNHVQSNSFKERLVWGSPLIF